MQRSGSSPSRLYCSSLFCECPNFCDLAKQRRKIFWGVSEVGKNDFSLYFCWRCVVFLVLYYFSAAIARLVWERRTTCWVTMRVPDPNIPIVRRPLPVREGRDLDHHVTACSEGAGVRGHAGGGGGLCWACFRPHFCWGGGGQQKACSPVSWSPRGTSPRPAPSLCGG